MLEIRGPLRRVANIEPTPILTGPEAAFEWEWREIFGNVNHGEEIPEKPEIPEPIVERDALQRGLIDKLLVAVESFVKREQNREPQLIQLEPQINIAIPTQPVAVSVEMPAWSETDVITRDEDGFISTIKRKVGPAPDPNDGPPERPTIQDEIRRRMGLPPK